MGMDVGLMDADWEGAVGYYPDLKKVFGMTALSLNLSVIMGFLRCIYSYSSARYGLL